MLCALLVLALASSAVASHADGYAAVDRLALLHSIGQVETGGRDELVGAAGERWRWQIMPATWRIHSDEHIHSASPAEAERVASAELDRLARILAASGREVTPLALALAWHRGPGKSAFSARELDYAERVCNLYYESAGGFSGSSHRHPAAEKKLAMTARP